MNIIEFIFDNPFILVILIGILSGLFGKKKQEEQQRRKHPQKKSTGPVAQPFEFPWEDRSEENEKESSQPKNAEEDLFEEYEEDDWDLEESVLEAEPVTTEKRQAAIREETLASSSLQPIDYRQEALAVPQDVSPALKGRALDRPQDTADLHRKAKNVSKVNRQQVVQGIIWSQILGEPRAREPHRPRNFQYGQRRS